MVLDTCWPPDALFFTPDRLLVRASEVGAATKGANLNPRAQFIKTVTSTDYTTSAPRALQAQGLTLEQNEAPMGTMHLVNASVFLLAVAGALSRSRAPRSRPISAVCTPAPNGRRPGGPTFAPALAMPPQLAGAVVTGHDAPLDVEIDSAGGTPTEVVLRTTVILEGGSAPGEHTMTVVLPVHGAVVTIGSWSFS